MTRDEQKSMAQGRESARHDAWLWRQGDPMEGVYHVGYPDYAASVECWFRGYWLQWAKWKNHPGTLVFHHDKGIAGEPVRLVVGEETKKVMKSK